MISEDSHSSEAIPDILDTDTEREVLYRHLVDYTERRLKTSIQPDATVSENDEAIAAMAVTVVLHRLRVMSARQVAVLLSTTANRHESWHLFEPPRYTAEEIEDAS